MKAVALGWEIARGLQRLFLKWIAVSAAPPSTL